MAILIMLDGADGTGKSTEVDVLVDMFKRTGLTARPVSAFGGPGGAELRKQVRDNAVPPTEVVGLILESLKSVITMISEDDTDTYYFMDRGIVSTIAQQGILDEEVILSGRFILNSFMEILADIGMSVGLLYMQARTDVLEKRLGQNALDNLEAKYSIAERNSAYWNAYALVRNHQVPMYDPGPFICTRSFDTSDVTPYIRLKQNETVCELAREIMNWNKTTKR